MQTQQQEIAGLRDQLKTILAEALNGGGAAVKWSI